MQGGFFHYFLLAGLALALAIAAFTDIRRREIDNWLNGAIAAGAPLFWWASGTALWPGVAIHIGVAAAAFLVMLCLFAFRLMGGGDVKLLTAVALWISPLWFVRMLIVMALAGGVLTLVLACWHYYRKRKDKLAVPYGVAIAFAGLWALGAQYWPALVRGTALAG
jgi:prepilin peptidase CpaA